MLMQRILGLLLVCERFSQFNENNLAFALR